MENKLKQEHGFYWKWKASNEQMTLGVDSVLNSEETIANKSDMNLIVLDDQRSLASQDCH